MTHLLNAFPVFEFHFQIFEDNYLGSKPVRSKAQGRSRGQPEAELFKAVVALEEGTEVIQKPFSPKTLLARIQGILHPQAA
jgi:hypothetical protein